MRIQHNIMAMNAYRNYTNNTSALGKNLEKLSSGYKINRAGDDAAGLAISEKMRAQITGLDVAQKNAKDGISLVQTAEGALTEVHDMLNRMVELAEQSANGTYENKTDRDQLQKEFEKLTEEIDRIADASNFNGINLLNGKVGGPAVTATDGTMIGVPPTVTNATSATMTYTSGNGAAKDKLEFNVSGMAIKAPTDGAKDSKVTIGGMEITVTKDMTDADIATALDGKTVTIGGDTFTAATSNGTKITLTATATAVNAAAGAMHNTDFTVATVGGKAPAKTEIDFTGKTGADLFGGTMTLDGKTYEFVKTGEAATGTNVAIELDAAADAAAIATAVNGKLDAGAGFDKAVDGNKVTLTETAAAAGNTKAPKVKFAGIGINLQIGDTGDDYNRITVEIGSIKKDALKDLTEGTNKALADLKVSTENDAVEAMKSLKGMINYVSDVRGTLGATQNRLDHTIKNLSVMEENIQDAEATIRDTDVADEMMAYTKNNILIQSAQAMLAQANQVPQGVLQLLQ